MAITTPSDSDFDIPYSNELICIQAENTLMQYCNLRVKALHLVSKNYQFGFPYVGSSDMPTTNYRFLCLLEKSLKKKVPHVFDVGCKFWSKTKDNLLISLVVSDQSRRYVRRLNLKARKLGFSLGGSPLNVGQLTDYFDTKANQYTRFLKIQINPQFNWCGRFGIAKLIYYYEDIEQILINMSRLAFYESV